MTHTNTLIWVPPEKAKMGIGNGKKENWPSVSEVQKQTNNKQGNPLGRQALEERVQWASFWIPNSSQHHALSLGNVY